MEVAGSNPSNASCFSDKLCNSPRFIKHTSSDEQSLDFKFSGSIRILSLCLMHECEAWDPFQLREHRAYEASQTLIFLRPIESCNGKPMWSSSVDQPPLHGSWDNATIWYLASGGMCQQWHTRVYRTVLCSWLCEVKEQLPLSPGCGTCQVWLATFCSKFSFLLTSAWDLRMKASRRLIHDRNHRRACNGRSHYLNLVARLVFGYGELM